MGRYRAKILYLLALIMMISGVISCGPQSVTSKPTSQVQQDSASPLKLEDSIIFGRVQINLGEPSEIYTKSGPVTFDLNLFNTSQVNLSNDDITLLTTGSATGIVNLISLGETSKIIKITNMTGNGTISVKINQGTAVGVNGDLTSEVISSPITVDNVPPTTPVLRPLSTTLIPSADYYILWEASVDKNLSHYRTKACTVNDCVTGCTTPTDNITTDSGTVNGLLDNTTYFLCVQSEDFSGNVSGWAVSSASVTTDLIDPLLALTSFTGGEKIKANANELITWTASDTNLGTNPINLEFSSDSGLTWQTLATGLSQSGPGGSYSWDLTGVNSNQYRVRITAFDLAGRVSQVESSTNIIIDGKAPTIQTGSFKTSNGSTDLIDPNFLIDFVANDPGAVSNITHFILKVNDSTPPSLTDPKWLNAIYYSPDGLLSTTLDVQNYLYTLDGQNQTYNLYLWVRDEFDQISTLSSAGQGVIGVDKLTVKLTKDVAPQLDQILVSKTDSIIGTDLIGTNLSFTTNDSIFMKWSLTDIETLGADAIDIHYSTDDINWEVIQEGIANESDGCLLDSPTSPLDDLSTGCITWSIPTEIGSNYFSVRISAKDTSGQTVEAYSNPLNAKDSNGNYLNILAGNFSSGLNTHASRGLLYFDNRFDRGDHQSLVVDERRGNFYIRDIKRGILVIDIKTGLLTTLISMTGTSSGDGGDISNATLKAPYRIALDYKGNLLIWDHNVLRKVDFSVTPATIDTLISGLTPPSGLTNFDANTSTYLVPLPNGDLIYPGGVLLDSATNGSSINQYKALSQTVTALSPNGVGHYADIAQDISLCQLEQAAIGFDASQGDLDTLLINIRSNENFVGCTSSPGLGTVVKLNILTAARLNPQPGTLALPGGNDGNYQYVTGRNGLIYAFSRKLGTLHRFDSVSNSWSASLLGTGGTLCLDNMLATSCYVDLLDVFVTEIGKIYFVDKGQIRTISSTGTIQTLYGEKHFKGDGGYAWDAVIGDINEFDVYEDSGKSKIVFTDRYNFRLREIEILGTMDTIAGNGILGTSLTGVDAVTTSLYPLSNYGGDEIAVDQSLGNIGDVYYRRSEEQLAYLDRDVGNGQWVDFAGGGAVPYYLAADNTANIDFADSIPKVMGYDSNQNSVLTLVTQCSLYSANNDNAFMLMYDNIFNQFQVGGGVLTDESMCTDGTLATGCQLVCNDTDQSWMPFIFDTNLDQWLFAPSNSSSIRKMFNPANAGPGPSVINTLANLPRSVTAFTYNSGPPEVLYYCSLGSLYKYNVDTSTEALMYNPVPNLICVGRSMRYITNPEPSVLFIFEKNGKRGIGQSTDVAAP